MTDSAAGHRLLAASLEEGVGNRVFSGGAAGLQMGDAPPVTAAINSSEQVLYDLASLTKVVATLPLVLLSVQSGKIGLDTPVENVLPELVRSGGDNRKSKITVFHLLTHSSGLPAWRPYFIRLKGRDAYLEAIGKEPLLCEPGLRVVYSDLGFMLLGFMLERIWDNELQHIVRERILAPLGLRNTDYNPAETKQRVIAPTEEGNRFERKMAEDYAEQYEQRRLPEGSFELRKEHIERFAWRETTIRGDVHDCNAFHGLGGVSGHAGLFSNLGDLFQYMRIWRDGNWIAPELAGLACSPQKVCRSVRRGLGWEMYDRSVYGHTGFTGTFILFSRENEWTYIALTNRTRPDVGDGIREWRMKQKHWLVTSLFKSGKE